MEQEFLEEIRELLDSDAVQRLRNYPHHKHVTRLEHSVYVAYRSYRMAKRLGWDAAAAARGGLLHDLFFYDWHVKTPGRGWHVTAHPRQALQEAQARFPLTEVERDIIVKHMWPLAPWLPRYRESLILCAADKLRAAGETAAGLRDRLGGGLAGLFCRGKDKKKGRGNKP